MSRRNVGLLARRLTTGFYIHCAALELVRDPRALETLPVTVPPVGLVRCMDGTLYAYDWVHHLQAARTEHDLMAELDRAWLVSALVMLADNLAAEDYFDRAPILEMVRHLRNGVSHGNHFEIRNPGALSEYPAHTRGAACTSATGATFEITPELDGCPVLFDFMGPGDVLDVLISVGTHLLDQGGTANRHRHRDQR